MDDDRCLHTENRVTHNRLTTMKTNITLEQALQKASRRLRDKMNNTKCPHIVNNSKSRTTIPHYYCRKTGKVAVTILHQTLYCEECPYSKNENADKA